MSEAFDLLTEGDSPGLADVERDRDEARRLFRSWWRYVKVCHAGDFEAWANTFAANVEQERDEARAKAREFWQAWQAHSDFAMQWNAAWHEAQCPWLADAENK